MTLLVGVGPAKEDQDHYCTPAASGFLMFLPTPRVFRPEAVDVVLLGLDFHPLGCAAGRFKVWDSMWRVKV